MAGIMSFMYSLAPLILVLLSIGIILGIVRIKSILFFLLLLMLLPYLGSAFYQMIVTGFASIQSWKQWLVVILVGLIALRLMFDRVFRRK